MFYCMFYFTCGRSFRAAGEQVPCVCVGCPVTLYDSTQVESLKWYVHVTPDGSSSSRGASYIFRATAKKNTIIEL